MLKSVVIVGPAWPLRGGLATFDHRLARQFMEEGFDCSICSYRLQYPALLFPGKTQYSSEPAPAGLSIRALINTVNPLNWISVGRKLRREKPDLLVVRYWIPFIAPALGTILRLTKANRHTRVIAITDNVSPHEKRPGDRALTGYFLRSCDGFVTMSQNVRQALERLQVPGPIRQVAHPLYDNFGERLSREEARRRLGLPTRDRLLLFFGFIRPYKGLDLLLRALALVKDPDLKLLVAGEFYESAEPYLELIEKLGIGDRVLLHTDFIPDSRVHEYLSAADLVVQPYRSATQSGVTPLAYHFEVPMVVTRVGALPDMVPHRKAGLVAEPDPESLAAAIAEFFALGEHYFIPHLREEKKKYSWKNLTEGITTLAHDLQK